MSPRMITISFRGRKFTLEEIPSSLLELLNEVELVFAHELPPHWALQYTDIDGDRVMLTTQNDFEALTYECQNSLDSLTLNIVPVDFELSFEKNQGSGLGSRENSELEFEDSFNVVEEDKESEPKDEVADLDFSDVVTEEDQNEKEISILKVDYSPEKDKRSTSAIEASPSSIIAHEQDIVIPCRSPVLILEQASQTETVHHASRDLQMFLVERGSQTMSNARETGSTQDKNIQTALQTRESQAQEEKQVNLDSKDLSLEKENICPNIYRPQRVVADILEDKGGIKAQRVVKTVHNQCYCDGCGMCPIIGVRYRCSVCEDFDFCERCEATKEHPHLFLRIKNPQEYSKIKHNNGIGGGKVVKEPQSDASAPTSENEFSFKDLRRKFKETTFAKVMSNTYGQLPEQAMQTLNKIFSNIKTNISKVVDESSSEEEEEYEEDSEDSFDEYEISSRDDVLPTRGKSLR